MIVVYSRATWRRSPVDVREESRAFHRVECVRGRRDAEHVTGAIARAHESGLFVASAVQEHVSELVREAATEEPGEQELGEPLRARARAERIDQHACAADAEKHQLAGAPLHEGHPAERGLAGRVFSQGFLIPFQRDHAIAAAAGLFSPAETDAMRNPDRVRFRQDDGGTARADRNLRREGEADVKLRGLDRGLRRRGAEASIVITHACWHSPDGPASHPPALGRRALRDACRVGIGRRAVFRAPSRRAQLFSIQQLFSSITCVGRIANNRLRGRRAPVHQQRDRRRLDVQHSVDEKTPVRGNVVRPTESRNPPRRRGCVWERAPPARPVRAWTR